MAIMIKVRSCQWRAEEPLRHSTGRLETKDRVAQSILRVESGRGDEDREKSNTVQRAEELHSWSTLGPFGLSWYGDCISIRSSDSGRRIEMLERRGGKVNQNPILSLHDHHRTGPAETEQKHKNNRKLLILEDRLRLVLQSSRRLHQVLGDSAAIQAAFHAAEERKTTRLPCEITRPKA
jgi:hypothetical protein